MLMRLLPLGLGVLIAAIIMGIVLIRARPRPGPTPAEREASRRANYIREPVPPPGAEVVILVAEGSSTSHELEAVHWPELGWIDAVTLLPVEEEVIGWRDWPFRQPEPAIDFQAGRASRLQRNSSGASGTCVERHDGARRHPLNSVEGLT